MGDLDFVRIAAMGALVIPLLLSVAVAVSSATSYSIMPTNYSSISNITSVYLTYPVIGKGVLTAYEYNLPEYGNFSPIYRLVNYANLSSASAAFAYMYRVSGYTNFSGQTFGLSGVVGFHAYGLLVSPAGDTASFLLLINDSTAELDVFGNSPGMNVPYYTALSEFSRNIFNLSIPPGQFGAPSQSGTYIVIYGGVIIALIVAAVFLFYLHRKNKESAPPL